MVAKSSPWPAFNVERRAAAALKPYEKNARTHSPEQVAQIAASIREWGWTQPILVDEKDGVLAGHGRLLAALELGAAEVPVIVAKGWSKAQKRAYVLADNQLALNADWDADLLRLELTDLGAGGFDLALAGFSATDLAAALLERQAGENDPNAEWEGMPEYDHADKTAFRSLIVHFKDQAAVDAFAALTAFALTDKTRYAWFPFIEIETLADKRYAAE